MTTSQKRVQRVRIINQVKVTNLQMQNDILKVWQVYYQNCNGGRGSEVEWWGWGVIKGSFQNMLKQGWVKAKLFVGGGGF